MRNSKTPFIFLAVVLGFIALYSAYWVYVRNQVVNIVDGWIALQQEQGAEISYAGRSVGGYPYRISMEFDDFTYRPANNVGDWSGEKFQFSLMAWNFRHYIMRSPGRNIVHDSDGGRYQIDLAGPSALSLSYQGSGLLNKLVLAIDEADISTPFGPYRIDGMGIQFGAPKSNRDNIRFAADWQELTLPVPPEGLSWMGSSLPDGRIRLEVEGLAPYLVQEDGIRAWHELEQKIILPQALINYGTVRTGLKGEVSVGRDGSLSGNLQMRLDQGETLKQTLVDNGLMTPDLSDVLDGIITISADGKFARVSVSAGTISLLGLPIYTLPTILPPLPEEVTGTAEDLQEPGDNLTDDERNELVEE